MLNSNFHCGRGGVILLPVCCLSRLLPFPLLVTVMNAVVQPPCANHDASTISLVGFAHAVSHFFHLLVPSLFPWLMPAFGLSYTEVGVVVTVFFVVSGIGQALSGLVVDRIGPKPVLFSGILCCSFSRSRLKAPAAWAC